VNTQTEEEVIDCLLVESGDRRYQGWKTKARGSKAAVSAKQKKRRGKRTSGDTTKKKKETSESKEAPREERVFYFFRRNVKGKTSIKLGKRGGKGGKT